MYIAQRFQRYPWIRNKIVQLFYYRSFPKTSRHLFQNGSQSGKIILKNKKKHFGRHFEKDDSRFRENLLWKKNCTSLINYQKMF